MSDIDVTTLRKLIDDAITQWVAGVSPTEAPDTAVEDKPERVLPEGKRVVRTKSSGDRVYQLDEEKKIRQWVTNGDVLTNLGWEQSDVEEVDDNELLKYQMSSAIYKVDGQA
jgi:hypothetical protein